MDFRGLVRKRVQKMTLFRLKSHQEFQEYPRGEYSFTYPIKAIGNHIFQSNMRFEMQMANEQA